MSHLLNKIFSIATLLIVASCGSSGANNQQTKLRIVDLQGKPHSVQMRTPELNMQALAAQGNLSEEKIKAQPQGADTPQGSVVANNKYGNKDFGASSAEAIKNTMQLPTGQQQAPADAAPAVTEADILTAGDGAKNKDQTIEYSLGKNRKAPATKAAMAEESADQDAATAKKQKGIFVQTGSFSVMQHAKNSIAKIEKFTSKAAPAKVEEAQHNDKTVYSVLIGPFPNKQKAAAMVAKLTKSGHQAIIVKNK